LSSGILVQFGGVRNSPTFCETADAARKLFARALERFEQEQESEQ
jgi:hypothetical protein